MKTLRSNPEAGLLIRQWREEAGLTLAQLSKLSGLQPNSIGQIEHARWGVSLKALAALADALDLSEVRRLNLIQAAGYQILKEKAK